MMSASAKFWKAGDGWRMRIRAGNGKIVGPTEAFVSLRSARRGEQALWVALKQIHGVTEAGPEYCVEHHGIREEDATYCDFRHHRESDQNCPTCDGKGVLFVTDGEPNVECPDCEEGTTRCDLRALFYEVSDRG